MISTDLYNLTMSYAYWKLNRHNDHAVYHLCFRKNPFKGGFAIAAGLHTAIQTAAKEFVINDQERDYLLSIKDDANNNLFTKEFVNFLSNLKLSCDIYAIEEGSIVFPYEPMVRVSGPIIQCQIIETLLLNTIGFQTSIATKAARICYAAKDTPVVEFGMRRSPSLSSSVFASRAAFIGGCVATSNTLAGQEFGIPVRGTQSHSWVTAFDTEEDAFKAYASHIPESMNVFLVDTFSTLKGVETAIKVGHDLRQQGKRLVGIRIDSGDLAWLSKQARHMLDTNGFADAKIFVSNEVDEYVIESIYREGGKIDCWGVGTKLIAAGGNEPLGCVYKLSALKRGDDKGWQYKIKISEQAAKTSIPGVQQVKRFIGDDGEYLGDMIFNEADDNVSNNIIDPLDSNHKKTFPSNCKSKLLLKPIIKKGVIVYQFPSLSSIQERTKTEMNSIHYGIKRFMNPHIYPVGIEESLYYLRNELKNYFRLTNL